MPSGGLSSPLLAPKGQLMKKHSTAVLPVLLLSIVVLLASSCEARGLPVHGKVRSSSKSHRLPGKVGIIAEDYAWLVSSSLDHRFIMIFFNKYFISVAYFSPFRFPSVGCGSNKLES